jgi:hypothetical protein
MLRASVCSPRRLVIRRANPDVVHSHALYRLHVGGLDNDRRFSCKQKDARARLAAQRSSWTLFGPQDRRDRVGF